MKKYIKKSKKLFLKAYYLVRKANNILISSIENSIFYKYYYEKSIDENAIFVESRNGQGLDDNIKQILREISKIEYSKFDVFFSTNKENKKHIGNLFKQYNIKASIVKRNSLGYWKYLSIAKYLINDSTFPSIFIKKKDQIYLNTWHGLPLKKIGRDNKSEIYDMGNMQRSFLFSDFIVCNGLAMIQRLRKSFMLDNLYTGKFLCTGFPRNDILLNDIERQTIRNSLGISNKKVLAYMPTFRGTSARTREAKLKESIQINKVKQYLIELDMLLNDDQILYVNLHLLIQESIDFTQYQRIFPFPKEVTTYEFMNACDCMITDYSSLIYDFAITRKKIILFVYDRIEYDDNRSLYTTLDELPFVKVETVPELIEEINSDKIPDYSLLIEECCGFEKGMATTDICRYVLLNQGTPELKRAENNGKENVLIDGGGLLKNGITSALLSLYENVDLSKRNYIHCFYRSHFVKNNDYLFKIPEQIPLFALSTKNTPTIREGIALIKLITGMRLGKKDNEMLLRLFKREWRKHFGDLKFSCILNFDGYGYYSILLFKFFEGKRWIWLHNNMVDLIKDRRGLFKSIMVRAYSEYDFAPNVSRDILEINKSLTYNQGEKMVELLNFHNHEKIITRAGQELAYDNDTYFSHSIHELKEILSSDCKVFINIGRYSKEKGHKRLISAFEKFNKEYPDPYLIILGSHGPLFAETLAYARKSSADSKIIILQHISNPMPILSQCDLFIFSSFYEGFGLVLLEAESLGVPVISTRITGPTYFMEENNGYLCENSVEGIFQGMRDYMDGKVKPMGVDFTEYNNKINQKFEYLMEMEKGKTQI